MDEQRVIQLCIESFGERTTKFAIAIVEHLDSDQIKEYMGRGSSDLGMAIAAILVCKNRADIIPEKMAEKIQNFLPFH